MWDSLLLARTSSELHFSLRLFFLALLLPTVLCWSGTGPVGRSLSLAALHSILYSLRMCLSISLACPASFCSASLVLLLSSLLLLLSASQKTPADTEELETTLFLPVAIMSWF